MTNTLVGDVYQKIIEDVIQASTTDFEESGVSQSTLNELQQTWQIKLSQRGAAHMPWDPKVQPSPTPQASLPSSASNTLPSSSYSTHDTPPSASSTNGIRIKAEPGTDAQYNGLPNGYSHSTAPAQGGIARAAQLVQQQYGPNASASVSAMQRAGGLALPGQPMQQAKPQGLNLPQSPTQAQQSYQAQQQQAMHRQQQQQLQQQQMQPRIKVENDSPQLPQSGFQQVVQPNYSQTDGADDTLDQWQTLLAERHAANVAHGEQADHMIREHLTQMSSELQSGLMVPLDEQPSRKRRKGKEPEARSSKKASASPSSAHPSSSAPAIPQLDGDFDEDEQKPDIKDEDDEDAINSDLDDSDDDGLGNMGDDDEDFADSILCTYEKVQRVKNKWKCVLKDGVMSYKGKEWVFHKGIGEFEW